MYQHLSRLHVPVYLLLNLIKLKVQSFDNGLTCETPVIQGTF